MSFFDELKRRNVFKVGIAYVITAWLLIQVADILFDAISAPPWVMQALFIVLAIGFVLALIFAWAYELTPEGVKREKDVDRSESMTEGTGQRLNHAIIAILVLALSYFVLDKFVLSMDHPEAVSMTEEVEVASDDERAPEERSPTAPEPGPAKGQSVAVLPFLNMSSDPEQEYFSDGITEEVINALVKIPGLSVPARTSVFGFKGHQGDVRSIGRQLGVSHVLEGSIRSQGNQVRITAQLIKVDDGFHLWSETFDRTLDNIFAVQEEIAGAISTVLVGELGMSVETVPNRTRNMEAYDYYLQGRALLHKRGFDNLDKAAALFQQTNDLDPDFAPAWAALALTYSVMNLDEEILAKAISTARHALELDPKNVDALDALASALRDSWRWSEAEPYFEQAMAIDPQSSELLEDYAEFLGMVGRFDEYLEISERGYAIDPLLGPLADAYTWALMNKGRFDDAITVIEEWNRLRKPEDIPTFWRESYWKIIPLMASGKDAAAIEMANSLGTEIIAEPVRKAFTSWLESPADKASRDVLRAIGLDETLPSYNTNAYLARMALIHKGDTDFMINHIISFYQKYPYGNQELIWSPIYSEFRRHPRFQELLEIVGLPDYWDQTSWPDKCRREDDRIVCQ